MFIECLEWDEEVVDKIIVKHQVTPEEVEEVIWESDFRARRIGKNRFMVLGKALSGRYLIVIMDRLNRGDFKPVTARDMTEKEKKSFRKVR